MQVVIKRGVSLYGGVHDVLVAWYDDTTIIDEAAFPGCVVIPYSGTIEELARIGPEPAPGDYDTRQRVAPGVDLLSYLKAKRYQVEVSGVAVTVGSESVRVSTRRGDDRTTLTATFTAIVNDLRKDGATFNFEDGIPRGVSNEEMKTACLAAFAHIQASFDVEDMITKDITLRKIKTVAEIDAAFAGLL